LITVEEGHRTYPRLKGHGRHTVHIYWHKIGRRFTDKALLVESKTEDHESTSRNTRYTIRPSRGQINGKTYGIRVLPHQVVIFKVQGIMLLLSRLGNYLGVRKDLAGFVVTAYTGNVLPRLLGHVTLSVIQHDDVLHWWQKLELVFGFGFGTAGFDGAYECREGHLAVLRRTKWREFGGSWRRGPV